MSKENCRSRRWIVSVVCCLGGLLAVWPVVKVPGFVRDESAGDLLTAGNFLSEAYNRQSVSITALVTSAVLRSGAPRHSPVVAKSLRYLQDSAQADGGIYEAGSRLEIYDTCMAMMCLREANADGRYDRILQNAERFLFACQWNESRGNQPSDMAYGGIGFGRQGHPDLTGTALVIDAVQANTSLRATPLVAKSLTFVSRCQNVAGTGNGEPMTDGGFRNTSLISPDALRVSNASSGITTMCGLRCLLRSGVARDDQRVQAALSWIRRHYTLQSNPGMGEAGLYHYYHAFAETFGLLGIEELQDAAGQKHKWRDELCAELIGRQRKDGSWRNENGCWMEDDAHVATALALLTLYSCQHAPTQTVSLQ